LPADPQTTKAIAIKFRVLFILKTSEFRRFFFQAKEKKQEFFETLLTPSGHMPVSVQGHSDSMRVPGRCRVFCHVCTGEVRM